MASIRLTPGVRRRVVVTDPDNPEVAVALTTPEPVSAEPATHLDVNIGPMQTTDITLISGAGIGPQGPPGPEGPPGASGGSYTHIEPAPATDWLVVHNLGYRPAVSVQDSAGTLVFGNVVYLDENRLTISFDAAFSGRADCS